MKRENIGKEHDQYTPAYFGIIKEVLYFIHTQRITSSMNNQSLTWRDFRGGREVFFTTFPTGGCKNHRSLWHQKKKAQKCTFGRRSSLSACSSLTDGVIFSYSQGDSFQDTQFYSFIFEVCLCFRFWLRKFHDSFELSWWSLKILKARRKTLPSRWSGYAVNLLKLDSKPKRVSISVFTAANTACTYCPQYCIFKGL